MEEITECDIKSCDGAKKKSSRSERKKELQNNINRFFPVILSLKNPLFLKGQKYR